MLIEILVIILGVVLINISLFTGGDGLSKLTYCLDFPTLVCILGMSLPILARRGAWRDLLRAFRMLKKTFVCTLAELKRTKEAVELMQKQILYAGIITAILGLIYLLSQLTDLSQLGPYLAVTILAVLYTAVLELLLLPLQHEVKSRIVDYMEGED